MKSHIRFLTSLPFYYVMYVTGYASVTYFTMVEAVSFCISTLLTLYHICTLIFQIKLISI